MISDHLTAQYGQQILMDAISEGLVSKKGRNACSVAESNSGLPKKETQ